MPLVDIRAVVGQHAFVGEWQQCLREPLPFRVPVMSSHVAAEHPQLFSVGQAEYTFSIDFYIKLFLDRPSSEYGVVSVTDLWLLVLSHTALAVMYRDQHDPSSTTGTRPDAVLIVAGALVLRVEEKAHDEALQVAIEELTSKLPPSSSVLVPRGCSSVPAFAVTRSHTVLVGLHYNATEHRWSSTEEARYFTQNERDRVRLVEAVFKLARWMRGVSGPYGAGPSLPPGVAVQTPNGHSVIWEKDGIRKVYKTADPGRQARIRMVYGASLPHVERGMCRNGRTVVIQSVGVPLDRKSPPPEADVVARDVAAALEELHSLGLAHCDVRRENVFFVSDSAGARYVLGDLEYLTPVDEPAPDVRLMWGPCTALERDRQQFDDLRGRL